MIIAVDFDGVLCEEIYPLIGEPHNDIIDKLKVLKSDGNQLILWTCRTGIHLVDALNWCHFHGLEFDAVNDNLKSRIKMFGSDTRKVSADIYLDDKSPQGLNGIRVWLYEQTN